jgi:hypothetical protein
VPAAHAPPEPPPKRGLSFQQSTGAAAVPGWERHHPFGGDQTGFCTSELHSPPLLPQLRGLLTPFGKYFTTFKHSTCALSVPGQYSALQWIHLALQTAVPSHSTPQCRQPCHKQGTVRVWYGTLSLRCIPFEGPPWQNSHTQHAAHTTASSISWIPR